MPIVYRTRSCPASLFATISLGIPSSTALDGFVRPAIHACWLRKAHRSGARCSTSSEEASWSSFALCRCPRDASCRDRVPCGDRYCLRTRTDLEAASASRWPAVAAMGRRLIGARNAMDWCQIKLA